jgi:YidC/Oxa1 family membrane protein insertase
VVQLPIFFALFRVLRTPYKYVPDTSKLYEALCTTHAGKVVNVNQCSGDHLYKYLPNHQKFLGIDLSLSAPSQISTWATIAAFALVGLVVFTGFMQSQQAQRRTPQANKQMATVMKVLPVFFGFISLRFPAGLVLYFFVSNLWRLGQQEVIFRRFGTAANPTHRSALKPSKSNVVDAESRERTDVDDDEDDGGPDEPLELEAGPTTPKTTKTPPPKPGAGAPAKSTAAKAKPPAKTPAKSPAKSEAGNGAKPVAAPTKGSGGLRSIFQLPPPPGEAPKAAPAKPSSSTAKKPTTTTSSSGARPGTTGRRTSKKKRKR